MALLSDLDIFNRIYEAILALGKEEAETKHGQTAITSARVALTALQMALLANMREPTSNSSASKIPPPPV